MQLLSSVDEAQLVSDMMEEHLFQTLVLQILALQVDFPPKYIISYNDFLYIKCVCVWGGDFGGSAAGTSDENTVHEPIKNASAVTQNQVEDAKCYH